jgi:hypothetical protein
MRRFTREVQFSGRFLPIRAHRSREMTWVTPGAVNALAGAR